MDRARISGLRQPWLRTEQARQAQREVRLGLGAMIQGSFVTIERRCGTPTCRGATGARHPSKGLSRSEGGQTRTGYLPAGAEVLGAQKSREYRRGRLARAARMTLAAQTAARAEALQQAL